MFLFIWRADYCAEFLVHGVDVEGKMMGLEEELVRLLGQDCPSPVTYAGGSELMGDLDRVKAIGSGSFFLSLSFSPVFGGFFSLENCQASLLSVLSVLLVLLVLLVLA